jgi:hypothetical protein
MEKKLNHIEIDVGKRKCRAALKDDREKTLDEFFFGNNSDGILELIKRIHNLNKVKLIFTKSAVPFPIFLT